MISVDSQTTCHTDEANKLVGGSPAKSITFVGEAAPHRAQNVILRFLSNICERS